MLSSENVHPYASFWLDVADKAIKALAVAVAGTWTYLRAETYRRKVEPSVSGTLFENEGNHYVHVLCRLKNLGASRYTITQRGTYLSVEALRPSGREELEGAEVFKVHKWIEPGEQVDEELVVRVPDPKSFVAVRFGLRVISKNVEWNASCIIREASQKETEDT